MRRRAGATSSALSTTSKVLGSLAVPALAIVLQLALGPAGQRPLSTHFEPSVFGGSPEPYTVSFSSTAAPAPASTVAPAGPGSAVGTTNSRVLAGQSDAPWDPFGYYGEPGDPYG